MLNLRHMNPMVRAVGTMGAVSALVGGITFAQLTSNTVALSPNTLSTGSANLAIGTTGSSNHNSGGNNSNNNNTNTSNNTSSNTNNFSTLNGSNNNNNNGNNNNGNNNSSCRNTQNGSVPGFNLTGSNGLVPGVASDPLHFCLANTGAVPLNLTVMIPQSAFTGDTGIPPSDVTLNITCSNGGTSSGTLDEYTGGTMLGTLNANGSTTCTATVTLSSSFSGSNNESVPSFDIQFVGTSSNNV